MGRFTQRSDLLIGEEAVVTGDGDGQTSTHWGHDLAAGTVVTLVRFDKNDDSWFVEIGTGGEAWSTWVGQPNLEPHSPGPSKEEEDEALRSIQQTITQKAAEAEQELKSETRQWTIVETSGTFATVCPWCGAHDAIHEVDVSVRWNALRLRGEDCAVASLDDGDYEFDHWVCNSCMSDKLEAPDGFEIIDWY